MGKVRKVWGFFHRKAYADRAFRSIIGYCPVSVTKENSFFKDSSNAML
jgi:hypothetical protein